MAINPHEVLATSPLSRPWVRMTAAVIAVIALAAIAVYAPSCQTKRKSALTGELVPLEQAYEDLDKKRELDAAASERDAAKAAAAEVKDKAAAQAALDKATKEAERRTEKERREFARFADAARTDAEAKINQIEQEARAKITAASDNLQDAVTLTDDQLAAQVATIRNNTQELIDARNAAVEEKILARRDALVQEKSAIDAQAKADAAKWAWVEPVMSIVKKVAQNVPGGSAAADGINGLLLLAGGGAGLAALKKRADAAKSQQERDEYARMAEDIERKREDAQAKLQKSLKAVVSITDSIEQMKGKLPSGVWDSIKDDVRGWQGPEAEALVDAARNHIDPAKVL